MIAIRQLQARARTLALSICTAMLLIGCGGGRQSTDSVATESAKLSTTLRAPAQSSATVVGLVKVSETRVSRTVYDYEFKIKVQNGPDAKTAIMATATGAGKGTTILDGSVLVGDMSAGAAVTPSDTITLRQDRTYPFNQAALVWQITEPINGIAVPPEPDPGTNQATLAGVDTNHNGIRDDVERLLATEFGSDSKKYSEAITFARAEQATIVDPSDAHIKTFAKLVECKALTADELNKGTWALLNTAARINAYGLAFAGIMLGDCQ